jgi:hypothetical protein
MSVREVDFANCLGLNSHPIKPAFCITSGFGITIYRVLINKVIELGDRFLTLLLEAFKKLFEFLYDLGVVHKITILYLKRAWGF